MDVDGKIHPILPDKGATTYEAEANITPNTPVGRVSLGCEFESQARMCTLGGTNNEELRATTSKARTCLARCHLGDLESELNRSL